MAECIVKINGTRYEGWKTVQVARTVEACSGAFQIEFTDSWSGSKSPWGINPQNEIEIILDGNPVINGYVDSLEGRIAAQERLFTAKGRDKTGDLVDCSAKLSPSEFKSVSLETLARTLISPFSISLKTFVLTLGGRKALAERFKAWRIEPGESVWETLERASRFRGLLMIPDGRGGLVITEPASGISAEMLVEGENIETGSFENDASKRFSTYTVLGQDSREDEDFGDGFRHNIKGTATDAGISRTRPLIVVAEGKVSTALAKSRAQWEATVRAARAVKVNITVPGWSQYTKQLWEINSLVSVQATRLLGCSGSFLISEATYRLGPEGSFTDLTLLRPDAFQPVPQIPKRKVDQSSVGWEWKGTAPKVGDLLEGVISGN